MRTVAMALLLAPWQVAISLILLVSGAIGLATYQPLPDNSPFAYALPYHAVFEATLIAGVVILALVTRKARAEIAKLRALDALAGAGKNH
ncbi:hypothetical protein SB783_37650 [Paraburkholderia sp. SIMBA_009]